MRKKDLLNRIEAKVSLAVSILRWVFAIVASLGVYFAFSDDEWVKFWGMGTFFFVLVFVEWQHRKIEKFWPMDADP